MVDVAILGQVFLYRENTARRKKSEGPHLNCWLDENGEEGEASEDDEADGDEVPLCDTWVPSSSWMSLIYFWSMKTPNDARKSSVQFSVQMTYRQGMLLTHLTLDWKEATS